MLVKIIIEGSHWDLSRYHSKYAIIHSRIFYGVKIPRPDSFIEVFDASFDCRFVLPHGSDSVSSSSTDDHCLFEWISPILLPGQEVTDGMLKLIAESLEGVQKQEANTDKYSGLDKGPATYSVVKRARDNDADIHSNNTVSSYYH